MAIYAVVKDDVVYNTIEWDGDTDNWAPDEGFILIEILADSAQTLLGTRTVVEEVVTPATEETSEEVVV
jgi:hypothetical protein